MKLDLLQAATARANLSAAPLNYALQPIRAELLSRLPQHSGARAEILWIDFTDARLSAPANSRVTRLSLLESAGESASSIMRALQDARFDLAAVNLQLAWFDYRELLPQCLRVLKPDGELFFATLGPDSLIEIADAWRGVDDFAHVHTFVDLHHLGDFLREMGCRDCVLDVDRLRVEYADARQLFRDLKREGLHNIAAARRKTLCGKRRFARFLQALESRGSAMTLEVIYARATNAGAPGRVTVAPPAR